MPALLASHDKAQDKLERATWAAEAISDADLVDAVIVLLMVMMIVFVIIIMVMMIIIIVMMMIDDYDGDNDGDYDDDDDDDDRSLSGVILYQGMVAFCGRGGIVMIGGGGSVGVRSSGMLLVGGTNELK